MTDAMNTSVMNQNSLNVLKIQLWPSLICLVLGSVGFVSNGVLFFAVLTSKQLRTNFYFCQMHVAVSSSLWCLTVTIIGLKRLILLFLSQPESCAPADCIWLFYPQSLFKNISLAQASVMGFDRFLGVSMPVNYRTFRLKKLQLANISMWLIPICLISPISFLLISKEAKIPTCTVGQIWQPIVSSIFAGSSLTFDVLTIVTYAGLFAALMYRLHNGKNTGKENINATN